MRPEFIGQADQGLQTKRRQSVRQVCNHVHHAYRSLRLYPLEHPAAQQSLEALADILSQHLDAWGSLNLEVQEMCLLFEGEEVYSQAEARDNLAFLMYRDGIRELSLLPGIEFAEIQGLVECLAHADDLLTMEYDLVTALWEHGFPHIEYEVVDPFLSGGSALREEVLSDLRETVLKRLNEVTSGLGTGRGSGLVVGSGEAEEGVGGSRAEEEGEEAKENEPVARAEQASLSAQELAQIDELLSSMSDVYEDFAEVLLEILGSEVEKPEGDEPLTDALAAVLEEYLEGCNLRGLETVFERLEGLEERGRLKRGFLEGMVARVMTAKRLADFVARACGDRALESSSVSGLLARMRSYLYPALLEVLAEVQDKEVRRVVLTVLRSGEGVPGRYLWPLMRDPRWYVVRNAVQLATSSKDPEVILHLERLLRHPDPRVRREVVRSLSAIGGARASNLLVTGLSDEDAGVRILAVRGVARHGGRPHYEAVLEIVNSKDFGGRSPEEIEEILSALARLGGDSAVAVLDRLWRRRFLGTQPLPVRVAAVQALGLIPSQAAQESVLAAARCQETQVQRVAARVVAQLRSSEGE